MKFSRVLEFNAVPEWTDAYLPYDHLKSLIYIFERQRSHSVSPDDPSSYRALEQGSRRGQGQGMRQEQEERFVGILRGEHGKIRAFFEMKNGELNAQMAELEEDISRSETRPQFDSLHQSWKGKYRASAYDVNSEDSDLDHPTAESFRANLLQDDVGGSSLPQQPAASISLAHDQIPDVSDSQTMRDSQPLRAIAQIWTSDSDLAIDVRLSIKRRLTDLYIRLGQLHHYIQLNHTALRKIIKKYDKVLESHLGSVFSLEEMFLLTSEERQHLESAIENVEVMYARVVTQGDEVLAKKHLTARTSF